MCHDMTEAPKRYMDTQVQFQARRYWLSKRLRLSDYNRGGDEPVLVEIQAFWGLEKVHLTRCNELHLIEEHLYLRLMSSQGTNLGG